MNKNDRSNSYTSFSVFQSYQEFILYRRPHRRICMYIYICVCICIYVCIYMCVYVYIYIYITLYKYIVNGIFTEA